MEKYNRKGMNSMDTIDLVNVYDYLYRVVGYNIIVPIETVARALGKYPYEMRINIQMAKGLLRDLQKIGCDIELSTNAVALLSSNIAYSHTSKVSSLHATPVLIYNILTDGKKRKQVALLQEFKTSFGVSLERKAMARHLKTMHNGLFGVFKTKTGVYYNPKKVMEDETFLSFYDDVDVSCKVSNIA